MARGSERSASGVATIDRRAFLGGAALLLLWPARGLAEPGTSAANQETIRLLDTSKFIYVSPLRKNGAESTCHGEVWYAWLDDTVVLNTRRGTWKVRSLEKGLDRVRIWVGDYGRWKPGIGSARSEAFRKAPSFNARASFEADRKVLDRLIALFEKKYEGEFDRWREDMQAGFFSGQRKLIRYTPV